jgi:hypothetical protein
MKSINLPISNKSLLADIKLKKEINLPCSKSKDMLLASVITFLFHASGRPLDPVVYRTIAQSDDSYWFVEN